MIGDHGAGFSGQPPQRGARSVDKSHLRPALWIDVFSRGGTAELNVGSIDELAVWPRALAADEITES